MISYPIHKFVVKSHPLATVSKAFTLSIFRHSLLNPFFFIYPFINSEASRKFKIVSPQSTFYKGRLFSETIPGLVCLRVESICQDFLYYFMGNIASWEGLNDIYGSFPLRHQVFFKQWVGFLEQPAMRVRIELFDRRDNS